MCNIFDDLVQDCDICSAVEMETLQSCIKPLALFYRILAVTLASGPFTNMNEL